MLAKRNSDLYLERVERELFCAFSSRAWRACSTSRFFLSTSTFWSASSFAFSPSCWLVCCNSNCWLCQFLRQGLRLLQEVLGAGVGLDGVEHDSDALHQLVEEGSLVGQAETGRKRRGSITALTWLRRSPVKRGRFAGSPRPDPSRF